MSAEADVLRDVISRLENAGVPYMVTGSVAMSYYAQPRMTRDVDIVVELAAREASQVVDLFAPDYYVSDEAVAAAIRADGMFNIFHVEKLVKIDLILRKPVDYRLHEFSRRRRSRLGDIDAWIVSKEDLILSKLVWAQGSSSELQLRDVKSLLISGADESYLRDWAGRLGVERLLEQCRIG
jgi:hypothetical protein